MSYADPAKNKYAAQNASFVRQNLEHLGDQRFSTARGRAIQYMASPERRAIVEAEAIALPVVQFAHVALRRVAISDAARDAIALEVQ